MRALRMAAACLAMALLAACASPVREGELQSIRRIAVASACGLEATRLHVGFTVFANARSSGDIADWKLDEHVLRVVQASLAHRFEIVPARFDAGPLRRRTGFLERRPQLQDLVQPDGSSDAYLLIRPMPVGEGPRAHEGVGVYSEFRPILDRGASVFTMCSFTLYDRTLGRRLAWGDTRGSAFVGKALQADSWSDYTPEQLAEIRAAIQALFDRHVPEALRSMGLPAPR